jgi:hypothetical protein
MKERINDQVAICFIESNNFGPFKEDANGLVMARHDTFWFASCPGSENNVAQIIGLYF